MAISVVMPALELTQETGKLVSWLKHDGDQVAKGEPLLEVETDKAVVEVEAPAEGILAGIKALPGAVIPVGEIIAWIVSPGESAPSRSASGNSGSTPARTTSQQSQLVSSASTQSPRDSAPQISPKARRLAKEQGIDIKRLTGSGPGGEILASDIAAAAKSQSTPPVAPAAEKLSSVARLVAERTTQSWTTVPHFFVLREMDAAALLDSREQLSPAIEKVRGVRPTHSDLLIALVARVLAKHPRLNASWTGDGIRLNPEINVALAIAIEDGVVAPVIHRADAADLGEIAVKRRDLADRARAGRLRPSDLSGATFTISNLGMYGVDAFSALVSPPQAAILAVGRIGDRVVPVNGAPAVRPIVMMTLSCDHRVVDGARAASFLNDLTGALQEPRLSLR
jgi:pyruvate dehydrogenase E2 component (dihydrolipoamide acetyltransferase)